MNLCNLFARSQFALALVAFLAAVVVVSAGEDFPFSFAVTVSKGDKPISKGVRLADGHLRTNGNLLAAVNFGTATNTSRGPGAAILFVGTDVSNPSGTNWSTVGPNVDTNLNSSPTGFDPLFHSEIYGPSLVTLTYSNLNPTRVYVVQILHGEPRDCCQGTFADNTFTTQDANGDPGPTVAVPEFQLGNGVANENPANSNDFAVVTAEFTGIESFTYVMREAVFGTRGPSIAGFQLRELALEPAIVVTVNQGDSPIGNRPIDGHLLTNGTLLVAVNLGNNASVTRGPGSGVLFMGTNSANPAGANWSVTGPEVDSDLSGSGADPLFFSENFGPEPVSLTYSNLNPATEYLVQILHGEPRDCCSGVFSSNQFTTVIGNGNSGPTVNVPTFQLGNDVADENPPNSNDLAIVTMRFSGLKSFTYLMRESTNASRGPSIAGFQVRALGSAVSTLADSGPGSLRDVIAGPLFGGVVTFGSHLSGKTLMLTNGPLSLPGGITLDASALPGGLRFDGNGASQLLYIGTNVTATLNSITLTNGFLISSNSFGGGAAIDNRGTLTLNRCVVSGNRLGCDGTGSVFGGGVFNSGTLTANDCTFAGNTSSTFEWSGYAYGGAIATWGTTTLNRSTLSGNTAISGGEDSAGALGGAVWNGGTLTVNQCTFAGNVARTTSGSGGFADGGAILSQSTVVLNQSTISGNSSIANVGTGSLSRGGGIANGGTLTVFNSIVAGNFAAESPNIALGYTETGTNILSGDPGLAPLGNYGGPTQTMPPMMGSPVIDAGGDLGTNNYATDQRGLQRVVGGQVDIGAVEAQSYSSTTPLSVVVPSSTTVAVGTNLTLSVGALGTTPFQYQWFFNKKALPGATNVAHTITNIQTKHAGVYTVRVQNELGAATSGVATVKVLLAPRIKTLSKSQTVLAGKRASLKVSATGAKPLRYQWRKYGFVVPGATNTTLTIPVAAPADEGAYSVYVWNDAGEALSTNAYLTVPPLQITSQPRNLTAIAGGRVTLSVRAATRYPLSYQWKLEGTNLPGATNSTFVIAKAQPVHRGTYTVTLTNAVGELTTTGAVLSVTVLPVRITSQPRSVNAKEGGKATFSVSAAGSPPFSYQWRLAEVDIDGATNASFVITNVQAGNAGVYSVVVRNAESEATSLNALLNVLTAAPAIVAASADAGSAGARLSVSTAPDGLRRITILVPAGGRYVLEASSNLVAWETLLESTSEDAYGSVTFIDGATTQHSQRFYRLRPAMEPTPFHDREGVRK
ncbi:MAG: immunoglobulin domain-containing protein [Verrucomicrobia bacterium]|nr:immunoglobulin domain-containing protein [Verrucomicrobiota bacterium]